MGIDIKVPDSVDHAVGNLSGPLTTAMGNTFGDLWFLALGGISHRADIRRVKYAHELNVLKENTEKKINDIPPEKRVEPNTQIIMGALTDAQYCVESEELRRMFENLIASTVNSDTASKVHPSFSSIIRRMSPRDAANIALFKSEDAYPIANFFLKVKPSGQQKALTNVFLSGIACNDIVAQGASIECLSVLGLLEISYIEEMNDAHQYDQFKNLQEYKYLEKTVGIVPNAYAVELEKGVVRRTNFGELFLSVCL